MKQPLLVTLFCISLCSCKNDAEPTSSPSQSEAPLLSQKLSKNFPLLPLIEKQLWQELRSAEEVAADQQASSIQWAQATEKIKAIAAKLQQEHPFQSEENLISLGGIRYDKKSRTISIPAVVNTPKGDDKRHPDELELVLCSDLGRTHETLFVTEARPLHLEILLHLVGFKKTSPISLFRLDVVIPDHPPIPAEVLIKSASSDHLSGELLWGFSGSDFEDIYSPDQTGDFLILWHAHDSVLQIRHENIASGMVKLLSNKHNKLTNGTKVTLVLTPRS